MKRNFKVRLKVPGQFIPNIIKQKYYKMQDGSIKQADIVITDKLISQPETWLPPPSKKDYYFRLDLRHIIAFVDQPQKLRIRPIVDTDILTGIHEYYIILDAHFLDIYGKRDVYAELLEVAETADDPVHGEVIVCQAYFITSIYDEGKPSGFIGMSPLFIKPKQEN